MRATAARYPDRPAITFKDEPITFGAFDRESNRLASGLAALGLSSSDRMALYLPNCPQYELAFYAGSKLGAISCPMNPSYREREITYQVNDSGAKVMVTHASLWPVVDACRSQLPNPHARRHRRRSRGRRRAARRSRYDEVVDSGSPDAPAVRVDPASAGGAALLEWHHRSAEGRDAHASHAGLQPGAVSRRQRYRSRRRVSAVSAALAHLRRDADERRRSRQGPIRS